MDASVQSRATTVASAPMSRTSSILDLIAVNSDFFQLLASLTSLSGRHSDTADLAPTGYSRPQLRNDRSDPCAPTSEIGWHGVAPILQDNHHRICLSPGPSVCRPGSTPPPRLSENVSSRSYMPQWEQRWRRKATDFRSVLISPIAAADAEIVLIVRYQVVSALRKRVTIVTR
jgi:hypothetical protein